VVTTEDKIDCGTPKVGLRGEAGIHHTRVRAGRKDGYASAANLGGQEALVQDQRVFLGSIASKSVVADQAGFVTSQAIDLATSKEEAVAKRMWLAMLSHPSARGFDGLEIGLLREQSDNADGQQDSTLIGPIGVQIDDRGCEPRLASSLGNCCHDLGQRPAVIEVPVRKEDDLDARQVDAEACGIGHPKVGVGPNVQ